MSTNFCAMSSWKARRSPFHPKGVRLGLLPASLLRSAAYLRRVFGAILTHLISGLTGDVGSVSDARAIRGHMV